MCVETGTLLPVELSIIARRYMYANFACTGRHYAQFPDRQGFRLYLPDLHKPEKPA